MSQPEEDDEDLEEAYSPSGSITPPPSDTSYLDKNSKISLPSDLQDIIASLKKKKDEPKSMDLKSDPIVQAYRSNDEPYSPEDEKADETEPVEEDRVTTPPIEETLPTQSLAKTSSAVKVNRDPRQRAQLSLSQISDEELLKKASEMGFMNPENPEPIPDNLKARTSLEPPPPGLEEEYDPFNTDDAEHQPLLRQPPPSMPPMFINQPFPPAQQTYNPEFPPPHMPPSYHPPPGQFQTPPMFQAPPPLPPLPPPPSHIPFTNPQPPPPQPMYPPPPPQPAPLPPPPPRESPERTRPSLTRKKLSKKSKKKSKDRKDKKEKRRYSESPPPKDYNDDKFDKTRDRDRYMLKKREKRENWRTYDKEPVPEKRRDSWEYEGPPGPPLPHPPPPLGGPPPVFGMPGPMRGIPMRGRFQRGMRGMFRGRGFDRPPMRGFYRGGFHPRGHHPGAGPPPPPGPSRSFNIQHDFEEDIRRFEEQRKQKNIDKKRWRKESPPPTRKRRTKDDDSD